VASIQVSLSGDFLDTNPLRFHLEPLDLGDEFGTNRYCWNLYFVPSGVRDPLLSTVQLSGLSIDQMRALRAAIDAAITDFEVGPQGPPTFEARSSGPSAFESRPEELCADGSPVPF